MSLHIWLEIWAFYIRMGRTVYRWLGFAFYLWCFIGAGRLCVEVCVPKAKSTQIVQSLPIFIFGPRFLGILDQWWSWFVLAFGPRFLGILDQWLFVVSFDQLRTTSRARASFDQLRTTEDRSAQDSFLGFLIYRKYFISISSGLIFGISHI